MKSSKAFTLIELLVVIAVIAVLMGILMPALRRVREQARMVSCTANVRQWNVILNAYATANEGKLFSGVNDQGWWWPWQLQDKLKDWKDNKIWFCPTATKPITDENGNKDETWNIFSAWGIFEGSKTDPRTKQTYAGGRNGMSGSYGLNGYFIQIPRDKAYATGVKASQGYRNFYGVKQPATVPLMLDSLRFDVFPQETDAPAKDPYQRWSTTSRMGRVCIDRHQGFISGTFADGSSRKIGLKELWTLKWHQDWNINGPYTRSGGASERNAWPDWMRRYAEY